LENKRVVYGLQLLCAKACYGDDGALRLSNKANRGDRSGEFDARAKSPTVRRRSKKKAKLDFEAQCMVT
jgi:hypothetical protein